MGIRQILKSRAIVCTVPDERKARAVKDAVEGTVTPKRARFDSANAQSHVALSRQARRLAFIVMKRLLFALFLLFSSALLAQPKPMFQLHPPTKAPFPVALDDAQKARLNEALQGQHAAYNPDEQMLKKKFGSPGYHTTLKGGMVHPTRDAVTYAAAILDTGDAELKQRAEAILRKIVSLQDTAPNSKTYGIWSWFYEEPLAQMAPPDWNWADFIGVQLLQVALSHRNQIAPDLIAQIDSADRPCLPLDY